MCAVYSQARRHDEPLANRAGVHICPQGCTTCYERAGLISLLLHAAGMTVSGAGGR